MRRGVGSGGPNQWPHGHNVRLHSDLLATLRKGLCPGTEKVPRTASRQPQPLAGGTETGEAQAPHPHGGPSPASQVRSRPPPGPGSFQSGWPFHPDSQEDVQNGGREGGGGWRPSLTVALTQTPLHTASVAWREREMGKPVRAASGGISGRGKRDRGGGWAQGLRRSTLPLSLPPLPTLPQRQAHRPG